jgi:hypothetical protein
MLSEITPLVGMTSPTGYGTQARPAWQAQTADPTKQFHCKFPDRIYRLQ